MEHFTTERLLARDWRIDDAEAAFGIYGRMEVMRWLGAEPRQAVPSVAAMRERLEHMIERAGEHPDFGLWALELREPQTLVGAVLLSPLPGEDGEVEIGWHLNPDHWGHGYATESGRGVVELAFGSRGLSRLLAVVDPDNERSLAVCRRLGMAHLGQTDRYYGLTLELFELAR